MHKFSYIPQRFQMLGCTGCGRCARLCGAGMSMAEVCRLIDQESRKAAAK
jgi:ferredoxin